MWHNYSIKKVLEELETTVNGLTTTEVEQRLGLYGANTLPKKNTDTVLQIFFRELRDPIVILLIITTVFSFVIGEIVDAWVIIFIIFVDLVMGVIQEKKAEKSALTLANMIKVKTKVLRDDKEIVIDADNVVIGDIVLLEAGNKISADLRIIESYNLTIDESVLTGESVSSHKDNDVLNKDIVLAERKNMVYAGTCVLTGRATCVVIATGINTEIGKIASKVSNTKETLSPLTIRMNKFSKQITVIIVAIAIIITIVLIVKNYNYKEIFLSVIALSVSAMPEGLSLALTMALTIGSERMLKKKVIVKKLNAVESLGSCTVIASDKTGTLTVNEQTAKIIVLPNGEKYNIEGTGYNNQGNVLGNESTKYAYNIAKYGMLNSEGHLEFKDNKWTNYGDSIDVAFLSLALKLKVTKDDIFLVGKIPYESEEKYSACFYRENGKMYCTIKGSLEKVLEFTNEMDDLDKNIKINENKIIKQNEELASNGYRVIAIATGIVENFEEKSSYSIDDIPKLTFNGLVGFIDPIRLDVKEAIKECKKAGIKVLMITGDHPLTAYSIARELELLKSQNEVITGLELEKYLEKSKIEFDNIIKDKQVFARITPLLKLEIVESLKRQGEFVAVTGDGVNDAPAIKSANIGIAMGSGTDVSKETANMIIIDDSFKSIVMGIKEGRCAYSNIRKISQMLLSCGMAEVLFFLLSIIFDLPLPLVAIQLLWLNVVTDGLQDMALSFEKAEDDIMKNPPRNTKESLFEKKLVRQILVGGLSIGLIVFGVWAYLIKYANMNVYMARGYIVALMVFMQNIYAICCRSEKRSVFDISLKSNIFIVIVFISTILLQILVMEIPSLSNLLETESIPLPHLFVLFSCSLSIMLITEIYKSICKNKCK